ncbi:hypothetical protein C8R43DRAFT_120745 [Mycena crocata]|nr:hypothetical protein C8R43DRAFT_120745 [Mycena crocata]
MRKNYRNDEFPQFRFLSWPSSSVLCDEVCRGFYPSQGSTVWLSLLSWRLVSRLGIFAGNSFELASRQSNSRTSVVYSLAALGGFQRRSASSSYYGFTDIKACLTLRRTLLETASPVFLMFGIPGLILNGSSALFYAAEAGSSLFPGPHFL